MRKTPPVSKAPDGTWFEVSGPEGAPLVVLIHGLGLTHAVFDDMLDAFAGFRVLTYDLYGHGESAPAPAEVTLTLLATQVTGLLEFIGEKSAHLVGFSIGGMINRRVALDVPGAVASLVILNSPHDRGEAAQAQVEDRAKSVGQGGAMATMDAALKRWFTPGYLENGAGPDKVRAWRGLVDPASYAVSAWVLAHGVRELIAPNPPVSAPALVMTCENDSGSTPAMSHAITSEIAGAQCQIIPQLQHLGLMEDPDAFAIPIRKFLERHS
ncbi:MAG: alpha/beta fold hydrolase [Pseudomonadota bacterium]